jgi:photosynthetic reaction center cytochrome c subunit
MMNAIRTSWVALVVAGTVLLAGCERPPVDVVQNGFRGTGMENVYNPRTLKKQEALHTAPEPIAAADSAGPRAKQVYKNVQVLGDLSVGEFTRVMIAMTQWVSPEQGCLYCHNAENFADDSKYTKIVARRMTQMTQHLNAAWKNHVADTGVTCYTCHRGNPIPTQAWTTPEDQNRIRPAGLLGNRNNQNEPGLAVGLSTLPRDPFNAYFVKDTVIRQIPQTALPQGINSNGSSTQGTEGTYGLMMHMSTSLGVNCTYCHNTRSFTSWETSPPRRLNAYYGIRMVRELNNEFIIPLEPIVPASQKGPKGDIAKVNCSTCHQGAFKPLYGAPMAKDHPELLGPAQKLASAAAAATTAPAGAKPTK